MKKKSILFSLFAIAATVNAQEISTGPKEPELKKNELSINTAPVLRILLNAGNANATRFSIAYKRNLNDRSALRFSIVADMVDPESQHYSNHKGESIILQSDSILIKQNIISPGYVSPYLKAGYERLFGKRKLKWFYGADIAVGYSVNHTLTQKNILKRDSVQGLSWSENDYRPSIVSRSMTKTLSIGVTPFFGAKYPISKRFSISAQVGADMFYKDQHVSGAASDIRNGRFSTFDFDQNTGFINDISLVYRF